MSGDVQIDAQVVEGNTVAVAEAEEREERVVECVVEGPAGLRVDDICDGGRTFIELGKVLRAKGASKLVLSVTHGIFSRGPALVFEMFDAIYTTDSIRNSDNEKLRVIPVGDLL